MAQTTQQAEEVEKITLECAKPAKRARGGKAKRQNETPLAQSTMERADTQEHAPGSHARSALDPLASLEATLGHTFTQRQLLVDALTHRSYAYEFAAPGVVSNERLEFLGDAVLGVIASEMLYRRFPDADEGRLTQTRAALVRAATLAEFAERISLSPHLRLGRGEEATGGRTRELLVASAFEAVLGALYLDAGLEKTRAFLEPVLVTGLERVTALQRIKDDKSLLQELAQGRLGVTPRYRVINEEGPPHARTFTVEVTLGEFVAGRGEGRSKQLATQAAAHSALSDPGWLEALAEAKQS